MNKQTKKFTLATISALSLLGAGIITANQVSASENIVLGRDSKGLDINPISGPFTTNGLRVIGIKGKFETPDKQAIVNRVNEIRKEAYNEGLVDRYVPVKWSNRLEQASLRRAAESSFAASPHTRLTGEELYAGEYSDNFAHLAGNLAWNTQGLMKGIEQWYEEKQDLKTGSGETGHYTHMIDPKWTTVAASAFMKPKDNERHAQYYQISQLFAENSEDSESLVGSYGDSVLYTVARQDSVTDISLPQNVKITPQSRTTLTLLSRYIGASKHSLSKVIIPTNRDWSSSDTSVATIDQDGNVTAHKSGTTTITVTSDSKTYSTTVTVSDNASSNTSSAQDIKYGRWIRSGSRWWFKHSDGSYTTNDWEKIDGVWYRFDNSGWMQTGWVKDGSWYYLDGSGAMKTGWLKDNGSWYYLQDSGAMKTGWMKVSGKWYYAYSSGALAINTTTPDGYRVNYNGEWV